MTVRVLLADDHQLLRDALRVLLEKDGSVHIVAETGDGLEVVRLAQTKTPDVVCMDVNMPGMNGIEMTRCLLALCPNIKVIGLSSLTDKTIILGMLDAGASAYVSKHAAGEELLRAIKAVTSGQKYFCDEAAAIVIAAKLDESGKPGRRDAASPGLGAQEHRILGMIVRGHSSSRIAALLEIAPATVEVHQRNIMRKLGLQGVAALTKFVGRD